MGFISNYTEGNILDSEEGQNELKSNFGCYYKVTRMNIMGMKVRNNSIPAFSRMTNNRLDLSPN
jgi:hypothetical protein